MSDAGCCMLGMLQRFMELFIGLKTCPAWQIAPSPGTDRYCDVGNVRTTLPLFDKFDECCTSGDMEVWNMQDNTSSVKCKRVLKKSKVDSGAIQLQASVEMCAYAQQVRSGTVVSLT